MKQMELVIVSGPSGAGKRTAIKALEDIEYYCVDNMPVSMIPSLLREISSTISSTRVAIVADARELKFLDLFEKIYNGLKEDGHKVKILFLDASNDALVRRFSETRRRHPLAGSDNPLEGILQERRLLSTLLSYADRTVDTTGLNVHELREYVQATFSGLCAKGVLNVNILSFGFRHGVPVDADLLFDVRFLKNPYFVDELKRKSGKESGVIDFVLGLPECKELIARLTSLLTYLVPLYRREGKSYLSVAIGCTGGRHRSVVVADRIAKELSVDGTEVKSMHRDVNR